MAGESLLLTERDRALLSEVQRFGAMTRAQMMTLGFFRSKTRANERLKRLASTELLATRPLPLDAGGPVTVYVPGPALVTDRAVRRRVFEGSPLFVAHQLGLVDIRIAFDRQTTVERWLSEHELKGLTGRVIPDAYAEFVVAGRSYAAFIEHDRGTETLGRIEQKVRAYTNLAFSGEFERQFKRRFFRLLLIATSPRRVENLAAATARITDKVVRLTTLAQLTTSGPLASIWRRPSSNDFESLTSA